MFPTCFQLKKELQIIRKCNEHSSLPTLEMCNIQKSGIPLFQLSIYCLLALNSVFITCFARVELDTVLISPLPGRTEVSLTSMGTRRITSPGSGMLVQANYSSPCNFPRSSALQHTLFLQCPARVSWHAPECLPKGQSQSHKLL